MAATAQKKGPGRPKKTKTVDLTVDLTESGTSTPNIPQKVWEKKDKVYRVLQGGGIVYSLPQDGVTIFDESSNSVREMRYCPNEQSIWRDEQSEYAKREHIMFYDGLLYVPYTKPNLIEFLERHPGNETNGGSRFALIDNEKTAEEELTNEFQLLDAIQLVRDKNIEDLLPVALFYNIGINRPSSEIRFDLLQQARSNPADFIRSFDNPMVRTRSVVKTAEMYQIIKCDENGTYWFDSGRLIVSTPVGQDSIDVMAKFCLTDKGSLVFSELEQKVDRL